MCSTSCLFPRLTPVSAPRASAGTVKVYLHGGDMTRRTFSAQESAAADERRWRRLATISHFLLGSVILCIVGVVSGIVVQSISHSIKPLLAASPALLGLLGVLFSSIALLVV